MRRRALFPLYHLAARAWLTASALSLLLPEQTRGGLWLPLHLALAGAVSAAISGSMQTFAAGLTAAPDPPLLPSVVQFSLVTAGASFVAAGVPSGVRWSVAAGGASFAAGAALLGAIVARRWRSGLNHRFWFVFFLYGAAVAAILAGAAIGAFLGAGAVSGAASFVALRDAHMVANVLGWGTLTIAGTLITLLPTVLRVRIPPWHAVPAVVLLTSGVGALAAGQALRSDALGVAGALSLLAGAIGIGVLALRAVRTPRRHFVAVSAKHIVMALVWFLAGCAALATHAARSAFGPGTASLKLSGFRDTFLVTFVAGWILQALLGAWLYLLPAQRIGGSIDRRLLLAGVEHGATLQVALLNGGLALVAIRSLGSPEWVTSAGAALALAGGSMALAKAWAYGGLARLGRTARLAGTLWRPVP